MINNKFGCVIFCIFLIVLLASSNVYAQSDSPYIDKAGTSIILKPKGHLYSPSKEQSSLIFHESFQRVYFDFIIDLSRCNTKKMSKQTEVEVSYFFRTKQDVDYDLYGVRYKDKLYFVRPEDVVDNSFLDKKNQIIREEYDELLNTVSTLKKEYNNLLFDKEKEINQALDAIENIEAQKEVIIDSIYRAQFAEYMKEYNDWYEQLTPIGKRTANILTIQESKLLSPNTASGCDYRLSFTNMSSKTIKYLYWYGNVYNAVGDKVACEIRDTYQFSGKDTGPIEAKDYSLGTWECIIYNWSARIMKLSKISIIYMDGSSKTLSAQEIESITGAPFCRNTESVQTSLMDKAERQFKNQIGKEKESWKERKRYLNDCFSR